MVEHEQPTRPSEADMMSRPRLYARAASLESLAARLRTHLLKLANENRQLRDELATALERLAEFEQVDK